MGKFAFGAPGWNSQLKIARFEVGVIFARKCVLIHSLLLPISFWVPFQDSEIMDTFQIECLKDGTWSNKIPTCKSKKTKQMGYNDALPRCGVRVTTMQDCKPCLGSLERVSYNSGTKECESPFQK